MSGNRQFYGACALLMYILTKGYLKPDYLVKFFLTKRSGLCCYGAGSRLRDSYGVDIRFRTPAG